MKPLDVLRDMHGADESCRATDLALWSAVASGRVAVTSTAVLTAAHVVAGARSVRVVFNPDLPDEWAVAGTVVVCEPAGDVAVVVIDPPEVYRIVEPVRFGRMGMRPAVLACRAVGFPRFKLRTDHTGAREASAHRDVHQADGTIASLSNWRRGHPGDHGCPA